MYEYDEECLRVFLKKQAQLFDEPVAETLEEAEAFLEDCMAVVVDSVKEVKEYLDEAGMKVRIRTTGKKPQFYDAVAFFNAVSMASKMMREVYGLSSEQEMFSRDCFSQICSAISSIVGWMRGNIVVTASLRLTKRM